MLQGPAYLTSIFVYYTNQKPRKAKSEPSRINFNKHLSTQKQDNTTSMQKIDLSGKVGDEIKIKAKII